MTPFTPLPAPNRISARPAASASFRTTHRRPTASENFSAAFTPIQDGSMLAAVIAVPSTSADGRPMPTGPVSRPSAATTPAVASTTASGTAGCGVSTRILSPISSPRRASTSPALMPLPPMSTPIRPVVIAECPRCRR